MFYGKPSRVELQKLFKRITSILSLLSHVEPKVLRTTNSNCGTLRKKALSIKKHAKTYLMLNRVIHFATILSSSFIALNDFISCN